MNKKTKPKLYETEHPYRCEEGGYYYNSAQIEGYGSPLEYDSILDYLDYWKDSDFDLNFIFRWDWELLNAEDYRAEFSDEIPEYAKNSTGEYSVVKIFYMIQRKGCKKVITINKAEKKQESLLRKHLERAWKNVSKVWEGIS